MLSKDDIRRINRFFERIYTEKDYGYVPIPEDTEPEDFLFSFNLIIMKINDMYNSSLATVSKIDTIPYALAEIEKITGVRLDE